MKRVNHLLPLITDMDNLRLAFWKAGKGKRHAANVLAYQNELEENLWQLRQQIQRAQVQVGEYRYFTIYEPKQRQICAAAFGEQVLHHTLMNVCHPYFDRKLIYDTYACRKGKGTYAALDRAQAYTRRYAWFLKLDVKQFFASIHHDVLKRQLARVFKELQLLSMFYQVIDSFSSEENRGLPIGNLTSQYFANHYLSSLDHYIKQELRIPAYVRYMDDLVLWSHEKGELLAAKQAIEQYVSNSLRLALKAPQLNRTRLGLPFLGYRLFPFHRRLLQKSKVRFLRKAQNSYQRWAEGCWTAQQAQDHLLPLLAFTQHANAEGLRRKVFSLQRPQ